MLLVIVIYFLANDLIVQSKENEPLVPTHNFIYNNTYKYDVIYNVTVNSTTQQIMDFVESTELWDRYPTRIHIDSNSTDAQHPLFITATQQRGVVSWQVPGRWGMGGVMARTLCPHDADLLNSSQSRPTVQLSTASLQDVSVQIKLRRVDDFFIQPDLPLELHVTPDTPKYFYFSFENDEPSLRAGGFPKFNYTVPKSVIVMIDSDDELCATVSIQNDSCPVLDQERDVSQQGYHLTMSRKGGITLTQAMFPRGFYVVLLVKGEDRECSPDASPVFSNRNKHFRLVVVATVSYGAYLAAALYTLAPLLVVYLLVLFSAVCSCSRWPWPWPWPWPCSRPAAETSSVYEQVETEVDAHPRTPSQASPPEDVEQAPLSVASLEGEGEGERARREGVYVWTLLTVALVYALPVVQLLVLYQQMAMETGNQDLCYYNFLCAHPLGPLADFNHVFSNVGYVLLGLLFVAQVYWRSRRLREDRGAGLPPQRGLLLGMGLALTMEGALSACYHLCPNSMNFQFDSSFMYLMAVLCLLQLYQNRHPDLNPHAHHTFLLIAALFALGLIGILTGTVYFWVPFTVLHLTTCLLLTIKIYYLGKFKIEWRRAWAALSASPRVALRPQRPARALLLATAAVANVALAAHGLCERGRDVARHILALLLANVLLYTCFYIGMKLRHRERLVPQAWLYLAGGACCWALSGRLFLASKTKWSETAARSRERNAPCALFSFYDSHDLWHLLSAAALYLCFCLLASLDRGLRATPRRLIPVF